MKRIRQSIRISSIGVFFVIICLFYLIILVNLQITGKDYYEIIKEKTYTRYETVFAKRGEIYDRNGKALVINTSVYDITLDYSAMPAKKADFNAAILSAVNAIKNSGGEDRLTSPVFPFDGEYPAYTRNAEFFESPVNAKRFSSLLTRLELEDDITDTDLINFLRVRYGLATYSKKTKLYTELYSTEEAALLLPVRFYMEYMQFSSVEPYILATDVSIRTLTYVNELSLGYTNVIEETGRTYLYDGYASHILGRIGKIPADSLDKYIEKGYSRDAYVGVLGAEKAYEEILGGKNGKKEIVEDSYGNVISERIIAEPVAGNDIRLTIDIDLQITAEKALADNIKQIREIAAATKGALDGEDASTGAATAIDPSTGEILAVASYPSFNLSEYVKNYTLLSQDEEKPLYNRALYGTYTPGSTFKIGVAAAALNEGVVTKNTTIVDKGVYDFGDYKPRCWIYLRFGRTHGAQNVVQAIQNSCNYYFYEVGKQMGIDTIAKYSRLYGLGESTGIEIGENTGILASPEYRENTGRVWNPGDTLQAAIGQSDNMFTPLQLSCYISTVINGGTRYRATLLKKVVSYPEGNTVFEHTPAELNKIEFKSGVVDTIKSAMMNVVDNGSAARLFKNYDITVGGKTGTAQVGTDRSDNALFVGFAPYNSPKITVSVVIEQGANGTDAAYTAKSMFDTYLKGIEYVSPYESEGK